LWLYRKVIYGILEKPSLAGITDLDYREVAIFVPLVVLTILLGVYPKPVLDVSSASVIALTEHYQQALVAAKSAALVK
jgi:NADH-quinone oxidoreductase subunit M